MRLGRLALDPATVAKVPSLGTHTYALTPPPPEVNRKGVDYTPGLYQNDVLPVCTAAGLANAATQVAALNGWKLAVDPTAIPEFFAECVGCANTFDAIQATQGAYLTDVLRRQLTFGFSIGPQVLVGLPGKVRLGRVAIAQTIATFGHNWAGFDLYERDMDLPTVWDLGSLAGNVVGGHCMTFWDYTGLGDTDVVRLASWGQLRNATWQWVETRIRESYAFYWRQLTSAKGTNLGVNTERLRAALDIFTAAV